MAKKTQLLDPYWWVEGLRSSDDKWIKLYCYRKKAEAKHAFRALVVADESSKMGRDHAEFEDFRLTPPEADGDE